MSSSAANLNASENYLSDSLDFAWSLAYSNQDMTWLYYQAEKAREHVKVRESDGCSTEEWTKHELLLTSGKEKWERELLE